MHIVFDDRLEIKGRKKIRTYVDISATRFGVEFMLFNYKKGERRIMKKEMSCCGTYCSECEYYPDECAGCEEIKGKVFWLSYTGGEVCAIYDHCKNVKKYAHCGMCEELPCKRYGIMDPKKSDYENRSDLQKQIINLLEAPKIILTDGEIRLEQASRCHCAQACEMKKEFFDLGEMVINGSALYDKMDFDEWIFNTAKNSDAKTASNDWTVATTFFSIRNSDDKMIGMIDVRHSLDVPILKEYAGHIGYSVRPTERKKGYATKMLKLALKYCNSIVLNQVMLGCYTSNLASIKIIEQCHGTIVEQKPYLDKKQMYIYNIDLKGEIPDKEIE